MSNDSDIVITPAQCRAGRALVRISQDDLATKAEVGSKTVADFEREAGRELNIRTLRAIRTALEQAGVVFVDPNGLGAGVRLRFGAK